MLLDESYGPQVLRKIPSRYDSRSSKCLSLLGASLARDQILTKHCLTLFDDLTSKISALHASSTVSLVFLLVLGLSEFKVINESSSMGCTVQ